MLLSLFEGTLT